MKTTKRIFCIFLATVSILLLLVGCKDNSLPVDRVVAETDEHRVFRSGDNVYFEFLKDPDSESPNSPGHATLIYGYTLIGSEVWFLVRDPWPVNEGETYMISYEKLCNGRNCKSEEDADTGVWYASIVPNTSYVNDTIPHYFDQ